MWYLIKKKKIKMIKKNKFYNKKQQKTPKKTSET